MERRLYRSRTDRLIWGVCGGLAKYMNTDPAIVRLVTILLLLVSGGFVILAYIILAIVVPLEPAGDSGSGSAATESGSGPGAAIGIILIVVGLILLAGMFNLFWWFRWSAIWAVIILIIGLLIVFSAKRR